MSQRMDRKTIKYCKISPWRSIRIEGWLARTIWIEGIRKGIEGLYILTCMLGPDITLIL